MGAWKTCYYLVMVLALSGPTIWVVFGLGGPYTTLSPGLRGEGLESQFGRGPRTPGQKGDGLVLLVLWVQAGRVFLRYPAGDINSRIVGQSGMACFVPSTVVTTGR